MWFSRTKKREREKKEIPLLFKKILKKERYLFTVYWFFAKHFFLVKTSHVPRRQQRAKTDHR